MSSVAVILPRSKSTDSFMRRVDSNGNFIEFEKQATQDQACDVDQLQADDVGGFLHSFVKILFYAIPELF